MIDSETARQFGRRCMQHAARVVIVHGSPAIHGERQRHERMPEQKAFDFRQGQYTGYLAALLRKQIVRSVPEDAFDDVAPFDPMKERRVGTR